MFKALYTLMRFLYDVSALEYRAHLWGTWYYIFYVDCVDPKSLNFGALQLYLFQFFQLPNFQELFLINNSFMSLYY